VADAQLARILGTTKATIDQVRNRTHWNSANIKPVDPVTLGLSTQLELDAVVKKAAEKKAKEDKRKGIVEPEGPTLMPASETGVIEDDEPAAVHHTADSVFEGDHEHEDEHDEA
jgi:hypothetical protein